MRTLIYSTLFLGLLACHKTPPAGVPAEEARRLLIDRNWIDEMPKGDRDRLHVFRFIPQMGGGVYQDRTIYAGSFELFRFDATGEEIRFYLPHQREHAQAQYRIDVLQPGEKEGFDLRLRLDKSPRGPATYYGWRSENQRSLADLDRSLAEHGL